MPSESGSSGPTMVSPGCSASATRTIASRFFRSTGTQRAISAMPPLPGAHTTSLTRSLRFTAQASACSRPPEPNIKTFMARSCSFLSSQNLKGYLSKPGWGSQTGAEPDAASKAPLTFQMRAKDEDADVAIHPRGLLRRNRSQLLRDVGLVNRLDAQAGRRDGVGVVRDARHGVFQKHIFLPRRRITIRRGLLVGAAVAPPLHLVPQNRETEGMRH